MIYEDQNHFHRPGCVGVSGVVVVVCVIPCPSHLDFLLLLWLSSELVLLGCCCGVSSGVEPTSGVVVVVVESLALLFMVWLFK